MPTSTTYRNLIAWLHRAVNRVDDLVPRSTKSLLKCLAPGMVRSVYGALQLATPVGLQAIRIQAGPLKGRAFHCSLRFERVYFVGNYEPEVVELLQGALRPGDTILDVGGHMGYTALVAAMAVGDRGRVVTFEANPANARVLRTNIAANPDLAPRIDVEELAAWDAAGTAMFVGHEGSSVGRVADQAPSGVPVTTVRLDDYVASLGLTCAMVKMDIEGGEVRALPGLEKLLHSQRPVVVVEIHDQAALDALLALADSAHYRLTTLAGPSGSTTDSWRGRSNYLAEPSERTK